MGWKMVNLVAERTRVYPPFRPFLGRVVSNVQLSPSFRRIVFSGPMLEHFDDEGWDQRVKLVLPTEPGQVMPDLGQADDWTPDSFSWRDRWKRLSDPARVRIRSYTVAEVDRGRGTVTIDFVVHGPGGPGSNFALTAKAGDEIIIAGPDSRAEDGPIGIDYQPGGAAEILLVADETALPAVRSILRQSEGSRNIHAFVELDCVADAIDLRAYGHSLNLVLRGEERGENLIKAVTNWCANNPDSLCDSSAAQNAELAAIDIDRQRLWETGAGVEGGFYAWMAGESAVIKELRRLLVQEKSVDRRQVAFMGYWRDGHVLSKG